MFKRPFVLLVVASSGLWVSGVPGQQVLEFEVRFNDTVLSQSNTGLSLGDRFILDDVLLQNGEDVGSANGLCTVTNVSGLAYCSITFVLPEGSVSTQFINSPPPEKQFPLFGGTGAYQGKHGSGVLIEHGDGTGSIRFEIDD